MIALHIADYGIFPAQSLKQGAKCQISTTRSAFHPIATRQQTSQFVWASDDPPLVRLGFKRLDVSARFAAVHADEELASAIEQKRLPVRYLNTMA